jgi:hypothetical protein
MDGQMKVNPKGVKERGKQFISADSKLLALFSHSFHIYITRYNVF